MALTIEPELLPPSCCSSASMRGSGHDLTVEGGDACLFGTDRSRLGCLIHLAVLQRGKLLLLLGQLLLQVLDQLLQGAYRLRSACAWLPADTLRLSLLICSGPTASPACLAWSRSAAALALRACADTPLIMRLPAVMTVMSVPV